jgi:hypothetical protein
VQFDDAVPAWTFHNGSRWQQAATWIVAHFAEGCCHVELRGRTSVDVMFAFKALDEARPVQALDRDGATRRWHSILTETDKGSATRSVPCPFRLLVAPLTEPLRAPVPVDGAVVVIEDPPGSEPGGVLYLYP